MLKVVRAILLALALAGVVLAGCRDQDRAAGDASPRVELSASPRSGAAPLAVVFVRDAGDPGGGRLSCSLDFGDGGTAGGCAGEVRHTYGREGSYTATFAVADGQGQRTAAAVEIEVGPPAADYVYVYAAGDIAPDDEASKNDEATADLIESLSADAGEWAVLALGDLAYQDGTYDELLRYYDPSWGRFKEKTYPVPGNHDYHTENAAGYFRYWGRRANPDDGWYALELNGWRLYALNGEAGYRKGSAQYAWLAAELADHPAGCLLAFSHYPRYSPGHHGDDPGVDDVWDLLVAHGGDLFLAGHDHLYARYRPRDAAGEVDEEGGMVQFVVGTGGIPLYDAGTDGYAAYVADRYYGVLELKLGPGAYSWRFVSSDGEVLDEGSRRCNDSGG